MPSAVRWKVWSYPCSSAELKMPISPPSDCNCRSMIRLHDDLRAQCDLFVAAIERIQRRRERKIRCDISIVAEAGVERAVAVESRQQHVNIDAAPATTRREKFSAGQAQHAVKRAIET